MKNKINGTLVGCDGNAYALMGKFRRDARDAGWERGEIDEVITEAKSGNYDNLIATLAGHYDDGDES